jgi:hypothetical protein
MEHSMTGSIKFPAMRAEVIEALKALSNPEHQRTKWGRCEPGTDYYDDLDMNVHILYDDTLVLPSPEDAIGSLLHPPEVPVLQALDGFLGPLIRDLGDSPDEVYLADPRWPHVIDQAGIALAAMRSCDEPESI